MATLPITHQLVFYAGTDAVLQYRWLLGTEEQDLTGWTGSMRVGPPRGEPILNLNAAPALALGADGTIIVRISNEQTSLLTADRYIYVLDLIDPAGVIRRFLRGSVAVIHELEAVS